MEQPERYLLPRLPGLAVRSDGSVVMIYPDALPVRCLLERCESGAWRPLLSHRFIIPHYSATLARRGRWRLERATER